MMKQFLLIVSFFAAIVLLPAWVAILIGILFLAFGGNPLFVIGGGLLIDFLFSAPIPALFGFAYVYTFLFALLSLIVLFLRGRVLE